MRRSTRSVPRRASRRTLLACSKTAAPRRPRIPFGRHSRNTSALLLTASGSRSSYLVDYRAEDRPLHPARPVTRLAPRPEAARWLDVSEWLVYEMIKRGQLESVRLGRLVRVKRASLPGGQEVTAHLGDESLEIESRSELALPAARGAANGPGRDALPGQTSAWCHGILDIGSGLDFESARAAGVTSSNRTDWRRATSTWRTADRRVPEGRNAAAQHLRRRPVAGVRVARR